ncbi:DUF3243 domain-containing protein [Bacillus canaveralius]|uniref:DUF3243 domain-containing protein n=1 Tax=Bacillus canaveralius TaxID=1403243 RepID=A0A2N5GPA5_9BACI|nr:MULTISPECIES: DUF3243 domain-containing protein [Bacillus]PLR84279.1 DUF3243 domain-containing protein [Bacillus canaveralius]PLR86177.1 DUF3243 domain-containing protein [Bacillus sp. V33-4]PLR89457.1 DUF3243 domain-containing protein [Bacillus canaveralius]RSK47818.1 DUF3243 domain-containing protein [Bacillus canaveralius]
MSILESWDQWKSFLGNRLQHAQNEGMNDETISNLAYEIGGYLSENVDPKNEQERVLADLWSVASREEQHAIASMMTKLVQNNGSGQQ